MSKLLTMALWSIASALAGCSMLVGSDDYKFGGPGLVQPGGQHLEENAIPLVSSLPSEDAGAGHDADSPDAGGSEDASGDEHAKEDAGAKDASDNSCDTALQCNADFATCSSSCDAQMHTCSDGCKDGGDDCKKACRSIHESCESGCMTTCSSCAASTGCTTAGECNAA